MYAYDNLHRRERETLLRSLDVEIKDPHARSRMLFCDLPPRIQDAIEHRLDPDGASDVACVDLKDDELEYQLGTDFVTDPDGVTTAASTGPPLYPGATDEDLHDDVSETAVGPGATRLLKFNKQGEVVDVVDVDEDLEDDEPVPVPQAPPGPVRVPGRSRATRVYLDKPVVVTLAGALWIIASAATEQTSFLMALTMLAGGTAGVLGAMKVPDLIRRYKFHRQIPCGAPASFVLVGGHRPKCTIPPHEEGNHELWVLDDVEGPKMATQWPQRRNAS